MDRHVALKVVKSAPRYTETALDEIKLLQRLITSSTPPIAPTPANPNPSPSPSHTHPGRSHVISFLDHFRHKGPNGTHVCMVFEVLGENLLGLIKRHQNKGVPMHIVKQIAKQVLLGLDYMHRCCGVIHTGEHHPFSVFRPDGSHPFSDLKPENVLICIDDVESIIQSELASTSTSPMAATKLVGVPPSKGRGGNQTPRSESVSIHSSQPLPSPSGSYGNSPMLDKWAFAMSKIDGKGRAVSATESPGDGSTEGSGGGGSDSREGKSKEVEEAEEQIGNMSLNANKFDKDRKLHPRNPPGPSLLTQMAPSSSHSHSPSGAAGATMTTESTLSTFSEGPSLPTPATTTSDIPLSMSVDSVTGQSLADTTASSSSGPFEGYNERITVKIADLGNGVSPMDSFSRI